MKLISQPLDNKTEEELIKYLSNSEEGNFDFFYMIVAYVKKSGVDRLRASIEEFRKRGGKVFASVGIDQNNTTIQGLRAILEVCDESWIFHNESITSTFHPKVYLFEKENEKGVGIIGSSNLTVGGLSTNYEVNYVIEFNLKTSSERESFEELKKAFAFYSAPSDLCKRLDSNLIESLSEQYLGDESKNQLNTSSKNGSPGAETDKIFGSKPYYPSSTSKPERPSQQLEPSSNLDASLCDWSYKGKIRWKKKLTNRDCQIVNPGTSPTGNLSLTAAGWKENGKLIDKTTYFRSVLFRNFSWNLPRPKFNVEVAEVSFCVRIDGKDIGTHKLTLRYNPNWESSESNYTTGLSWGPIVNYINDPKMVGKSVSIYDPPAGKNEPYFLEIN